MSQCCGCAWCRLFFFLTGQVKAHCILPVPITQIPLNLLSFHPHPVSSADNDRNPFFFSPVVHNAESFLLFEMEDVVFNLGEAIQ